MKEVWSNSEDIIGLVLKYILKWVTLFCLIIAVITCLVKMFDLFGYGGTS